MEKVRCALYAIDAWKHAHALPGIMSTDWMKATLRRYNTKWRKSSARMKTILGRVGRAIAFPDKFKQMTLPIKHSDFSMLGTPPLKLALIFSHGTQCGPDQDAIASRYK